MPKFDPQRQVLGGLNILDYIYPIFFVLYPIFALRQANITYVKFSVTVRSIALAILLLGLVWFLLRLILRDWHKAGVLSTLGMMLFFSYGHVYIWAAERPFGPLRHRTMILICVLIAAAAAVFLIRRKPSKGLVRFLNITGLVMISLVLVQSAVYAIQVRQASSAARASRTQDGVAVVGELMPDIYLIIVDGYTRSDVLLESYGYDNSALLSSLEEMGFYVAACSQSNYPVTNLSLISMMNMDYFYNLFEEGQVIPSLRSSTVSETVRELGYTVVGFENWVEGHFDLLEDVHLSNKSANRAKLAVGGGINEFESMLIETSFLRIFVDMPQLLPKLILGDFDDLKFYEHYLQTEYILEELKNLPSMPGPKFVLAHILAPHAPYIFNQDGTYRSPNQDAIAGYRDNVAYIDNFLPETIKAILDNSEVPPIIIIQGDHGPKGGDLTPEARLAILNAYYLEEEYRDTLYPTITPINSFRVIFNAYFEAHFPLLEDHSYFIRDSKDMLDQKNEITNLCQP